MTEDEVRDGARGIIGLDDNEPDVIQGVGQLTTFNNLGFFGVKDAPDGWYLPLDYSKTAIIFEFKKSGTNLHKPKIIAELSKNVSIALRKYKRVVGVLWNGSDIMISINNHFITGTFQGMKHKKYFLDLAALILDNEGET